MKLIYWKIFKNERRYNCKMSMLINKNAQLKQIGEGETDGKVGWEGWLSAMRTV